MAFVCSHVAIWVLSVGIGPFVIGLSQIFSLFSSQSYWRLKGVN